MVFIYSTGSIILVSDHRPLRQVFLQSKMKKYFAFVIWTVALVALYLLNTEEKVQTLCVFTWMGFPSCWGCGIGHAIHYALHGQWERSFQEHVLGIPATLGLLYLVYQSFPYQKQIPHGSTTNAYDVARPAPGGTGADPESYEDHA
jgi:Protein of unknown function (DUF2752)